MTASNPWFSAGLESFSNAQPPRCATTLRWLAAGLTWAFAWLAFAQPSDHFVDTPRPTESQVKAIYLYNFAKFVTWPPDTSSPNAPMTICLDHADSFVPVLQDAVSGEKIDGRSVSIRRISSASEGAACSILYIDSSEAARAQEFLAAAAGHDVLTVSDISGFAKRGGIIEFVLEGSRVRFKVDLSAAQKAHLGLSSQLLKVAQSVSGNRMGGDVP